MSCKPAVYLDVHPSSRRDVCTSGFLWCTSARSFRTPFSAPSSPFSWWAFGRWKELQQPQTANLLNNLLASHEISNKTEGCNSWKTGFRYTVIISWTINNLGFSTCSQFELPWLGVSPTWRQTHITLMGDAGSISHAICPYLQRYSHNIFPLQKGWYSTISPKSSNDIPLCPELNHLNVLIYQRVPH